ncbi:DUF1137 domain-containing protein [Chlamydia gallinacea]|uniref:DUF1137 domain-containing protein n=2 Tax=Chlamydia gallinacea TaxID=1457153 RepID=A0A173DYU0_9CHLA|nr:DUF1137 domain-containing protein [Chlamydia gallinacea]EYE60598.1 hypothetical protein M127_5435 [Bacteroides fragilis str. S6L5]ANG66094.1 hypothetical protein M787_002005 [Chlamydia gallinacea 08-1274/3]AQT77688.1 hypothetical protein B1F83_03625 [Chlamydia gallinacea]MBX6679996.1 DUF1137 domain-containing protein [Chlamydia gallinacea]MBX6687228.1 DUF1137 domain-containing protein [Chlamydia gallinacea]
MTKFWFYGLLCSLGILAIACFTMIAMIKVDSICDVSCMNKHFDTAPPFLKIKKLGVHKQITSPERRFFNCQVDKSCMELHLTSTNYVCKEALSKLAGHIHTQDLNKLMTFQGKGGMLNYQDCSLNIYDCSFHVDPIDPDPQIPKERVEGGMKTLSLSLFKK